jgi:hypothetical protein
VRAVWLTTAHKYNRFVKAGRGVRICSHSKSVVYSASDIKNCFDELGRQSVVPEFGREVKVACATRPRIGREGVHIEPANTSESIRSKSAKQGFVIT